MYLLYLHPLKNMSTEIKYPWKKERQGFQDSLIYMEGRMKGEIRSILTPWSKWNDASCNGIEWNTTTIIGARPGNGKTLIADQLIREAFKLNPAENFRALRFQLEMLAKNSAIREYSSYLGRSYKYLCSADGKITPEELKKCFDFAKDRLKYPIDIVEESCTVKQLIEIIHLYMKEHSVTKKVKEKYVEDDIQKERDIDKIHYQNTIITLDHTILLKKDKGEDTMAMLYALGEALTMLKRIYPIAFIVLSQLNREIDKPERNENGKYGNYVLESDFFGADAMLQHADILIGFTRPGKRKIRLYGPDKYIIDNENILAGHFIKCRNGDTRISFFKAEFEKMQILDMTTPPQQKTMTT